MYKWCPQVEGDKRFYLFIFIDSFTVSSKHLQDNCGIIRQNFEHNDEYKGAKIRFLLNTNFKFIIVGVTNTNSASGVVEHGTNRTIHSEHLHI